MNDEPLSDRDRLLARLLTGELDPHGAEGQRLLEGDAELRADFEAMTGVAGRLDAAAAAEEELLAEMSPDEADERRTRAALEGIWGAENGAGGTRRSRPLVWWGLAAGVLLAAALAFVFLRGGRASDPVDPIELGGEQLECLAPVGEVDDFSTFRWHSELPPGYRFELVVRDAASGEVVFSQEDLLEHECPVPEEQARGFPDAVTWSVLARAPGGDEAARSPEARAHLRTP